MPTQLKQSPPPLSWNPTVLALMPQDHSPDGKEKDKTKKTNKRVDRIELLGEGRLGPPRWHRRSPQAGAPLTISSHIHVMMCICTVARIGVGRACWRRRRRNASSVHHSISVHHSSPEPPVAGLLQAVQPPHELECPLHLDRSRACVFTHQPMSYREHARSAPIRVLDRVIISAGAGALGQDCRAPDATAVHAPRTAIVSTKKKYRKRPSRTQLPRVRAVRALVIRAGWSHLSSEEVE